MISSKLKNKTCSVETQPKGNRLLHRLVLNAPSAKREKCRLSEEKNLQIDEGKKQKSSRTTCFSSFFSPRPWNQKKFQKHVLVSNCSYKKKDSRREAFSIVNKSLPVRIFEQIGIFFSKMFFFRQLNDSSEVRNRFNGDLIPAKQRKSISLFTGF